MELVGLYSTAAGDKRLEFTQPSFDRLGGFLFIATLVENGDEWPVEIDMMEGLRADMLGFFEELAANAEGWSGVKEWASEFDEIRLSAINNGEGTVGLDVVMRRTPDYEEQRRATLTIRVEDLERTAKHVRAFLGLRRS